MADKVVKEIDLDDILPNRFQPRIKFDKEGLIQLANSIKEHGLIQPVIVREIGDKYEIIAGERRYKASVLAGRTTIPALVNNVDDIKSTEIALIENVQRQDLTPIEEAASYKKILELGNLTQEQLAEKVDKKQSTVANKLRLLNLTDRVQEALLNEKISERHARSLLRVSDANKQEEMLQRVLDERLTVRQTDTEIDILEGKMPETEKKEEQKMGEIEEINFGDKPVEQPQEEDMFEKKDYNYDEEKANPGFLDIDSIEKSAQDINIEETDKDLSKLLDEEKKVESNLASENFVSSNETETEDEEQQIREYGLDVKKEEDEEPKGRFFDFSPGELIDNNEDPIPAAPKNEQTGVGSNNFDFNFANLNEQTEELASPNFHIKEVKNKVADIVSEYKQRNKNLTVEEIDLEDQYQIIIKITKE